MTGAQRAGLALYERGPASRRMIDSGRPLFGFRRQASRPCADNCYHRPFARIHHYAFPLLQAIRCV